MYTHSLTPQTETLIKNTAKALLFAGQSVKPSEVSKIAKVNVHGKLVQELIDELYDQDVNIRRKITTEGLHITFTYSRLKELPVVKKPELKFGYVSNLDLTQYNPNLYVAYHSLSQHQSAALFNTEDKYEARNQYKALTGFRHNDVRMIRLETFLKK